MPCAANRGPRSRRGGRRLEAGSRSPGRAGKRRRYAEAEPLYKRSLAIPEKALDAEHPDGAQSLENYSALLRETGRGSEAVKLEARARAIRAKRAKENPAN